MSSSPTTRIATTTVVAVSTASTMLSGEHGHPDGAGVLLVVGHREEARAQRPGGDGDEHREDGEDVEVGALGREDRPEEVLHEVGRGAAGRLADDDDAGGDAAVEDDGEGDVAVGAAPGPEQLDDDGRDDRGHQGRAAPGRRR